MDPVLGGLCSGGVTRDTGLWGQPPGPAEPDPDFTAGCRAARREPRPGPGLGAALCGHLQVTPPLLGQPPASSALVTCVRDKSPWASKQLGRPGAGPSSPRHAGPKRSNCFFQKPGHLLLAAPCAVWDPCWQTAHRLPAGKRHRHCGPGGLGSNLDSAASRL